MGGQAKHNLWESNVKTEKINPGTAGANFLYFIGPESYNDAWC